MYLYSYSSLQYNIERKQRSGIDTIKYHNCFRKVIKTQESIKHKKVFYQQVTSRLQKTDTTALQRQTENTNNKVRSRAKIRNRCNQAPHLTQDTNEKVTTSQLDITNESQEVSPFPAGDHKASSNRRS